MKYTVVKYYTPTGATSSISAINTAQAALAAASAAWRAVADGYNLMITGVKAGTNLHIAVAARLIE